MRKGKKFLALLLSMSMLALQTVPASAEINGNSQLETLNENILTAQGSESDENDVVVEDKLSEENETIKKSDETLENDTDEGGVEEVIETEEVDTDNDIPEDTKLDETVLQNTDNMLEETENEENSVAEETEIDDILPGIEDVSFCSNSEIIADKKMMQEHLSDLEDLNPGINYSEDEIVVAAENEEEAEKYADAFAGTLLDCEYGYALIRLNTDPEVEEVSVKDVVFASADYEIALPAAWPNYYGEFLDDYSEEEITEECVESENEFESYIYNDPYLKDSNANYQWQHYMMQTNKAWQAGYTGSGVNVAVIDSGVYNGHEDISLKSFYKWDGTNMVSSTPSDDHGHGTHCTGIVGAKANNSKGGSGIAPKANMYAFRVSILEDGNEKISMYAVSKSINKAVELGVNVISISIGSSGYGQDLETAVTDAYNNGTAVFVASGNYGSSTITYPAAYDKAIAVAAVNQNNVVTSFSNVSSKVRYTGPGRDVYSTYKGSVSSYTMMSGTSQATPCVAGAAAVLLSSGQVTGSGKQKVDNLLKLMDKSCVSSGVGKGTPNLAKGLGLATSTTAPLAPVAKVDGIVVKSSVTKPEAEVTVNVSAETGAKIYYALNNGSIKYKDGVLSSNATLLGNTSGNIKISGAASNTLKLIAISSENGLASREVSYTIKLEPKVSEISISAPNDVNSVSRGAALQLTANITPSYAKNKAVTWQFSDGVIPVGVTLSSTGKISTKANSTVKSVKVTATAKDGSGVSAQYTVLIKDPLQIKTIKATPLSFTINDDETVTPEILTTYKDNTTSTDASLYKWTSANNAIATCTCSADTKKLSIKGVALGRTTITGIDQSGQGKKITITVNVKQRISNITVIGYHEVAQGKTLKPTAKITPVKVSDSKLIWELIGVPSSATVTDCGVSVNKSNGTVTTKATAAPGKYTIKVTANDVGKKTTEFSFYVISASSMMKNMNISEKEMRLYRVTNSGNAPTSGTFTVTFDTGRSDCLSVTSSLPGIVTASITGCTVNVHATGKGTGTAKITVVSTDGSNLKKECKVTVVNPPTKMYLTVPKGRSNILAYNKTLKLTPVFVTENGTIDAKSKTLEWSSSNPNYLTVDKSGNVKAVNPYGLNQRVEITAKTMDGSNLTATYNIYPNGYANKMVAYNYASTFKRIEFKTYGMGTMYCTYQVTVSGPTNGLMGKMEDNSFVINNITKKGNYTITVKRLDGSNLSASTSVRVK